MGFFNTLTATAAIWRNLNVLNPSSKVSLLELYKNRILQQTVMKSVQLGVFVQLQNFLSEQLPKDKQGLATAIAYPLVSIPSQGVIYTNLVQGYFQISGVPQKPVTLPAELSGPLAPLLSGSLCGLMTQELHNLALTESSMAGKNETPSTLGAFRILKKEHGLYALIYGGSGRILNIAIAVLINNFFLQVLKETPK